MRLVGDLFDACCSRLEPSDTGHREPPGQFHMRGERTLVVGAVQDIQAALRVFLLSAQSAIALVEYHMCSDMRLPILGLALCVQPTFDDGTKRNP